MARFKYTMAALAAAGLAFAQPALAAERIASPVDETEAAAPGSTMIVGLLGLVGVIFAIMALSNSSDPTAALPTSP
jgi:hypothetical protein